MRDTVIYTIMDYIRAINSAHKNFVEAFDKKDYDEVALSLLNIFYLKEKLEFKLQNYKFKIEISPFQSVIQCVTYFEIENSIDLREYKDFFIDANGKYVLVDFLPARISDLYLEYNDSEPLTLLVDDKEVIDAVTFYDELRSVIVEKTYDESVDIEKPLYEYLKSREETFKSIMAKEVFDAFDFKTGAFVFKLENVIKVAIASNLIRALSKYIKRNSDFDINLIFVNGKDKLIVVPVIKNKKKIEDSLSI